MRYIGQAHLETGDYAQALPALEQAMRMAEETGDVLQIAQTRYWMGHACLASGDLDGAEAAAARAQASQLLRAAEDSEQQYFRTRRDAEFKNARSSHRAGPAAAPVRDDQDG